MATKRRKMTNVGDVVSATGHELFAGHLKKKTSIELPLFLWSEAKIIAIREKRDLRDLIIDSLGRYVRETLRITEEQWQRRVRAEKGGDDGKG